MGFISDTAEIMRKKDYYVNGSIHVQCKLENIPKATIRILKSQNIRVKGVFEGEAPCEAAMHDVVCHYYGI